MSQSPNIPRSNHNIKWIDTPSDLDSLIAVLSGQPLVAVDTESDSLYSYYEKVCLIQFSIPGTDYLVDPLAVDVAGLAEVFANPHIQKVFHAAEYDFLSLKRDYGFSFANLFDTMVAARILGWARYGLGPLLHEHFSVTLDKRFQRYNWGLRPLSRQALDYAHLDTHYLLRLREIQIDEIRRLNREQESAEAFKRLTQVEPSPRQFDPDDFWRIKYARDLKPQQQAVLKELFILREEIARRLDRPPFKVMTNKVLIELARFQPKTVDQLRETKGLGSKLLQYNGQDVLHAIQSGQNAEPPLPVNNHNHRPDNSTLVRYEVLRQWRNDVAARRGVEPDVIITNQTLMDIARSNPKNLRSLTQLGDWQRQTYGKSLLKVLKNR